MPDEPTPVEGTEETKDPVGGEQSEEKGSTADTPVYTEERFQATLNKRMEQAGRERKKLEKQLAEAKTASMSEDEKRIENAKKEGATEERTKREGLERRMELQDTLLDEGANPKQMRKALALAGEFAPDGSPEDVVAALKEHAPEVFQSKTTIPSGDGPNPPGGDDLTTDYSADAVQAKLKEPGGRAWYIKNRDKINQAHAEKTGMPKPIGS